MNVLIPFIKTQKKISWKLYYVSYVNKLGMFQNDMMSYDSTLFHGTLTNWGHEKNWVKTKVWIFLEVTSLRMHLLSVDHFQSSKLGGCSK
jgi:hypothetical protein